MADFTVTCQCGRMLHSEDAHVGRRVRCECGQIITIERPSGTGIDTTRHRKRRKSSVAWEPIVTAPHGVLSRALRASGFTSPTWRHWPSELFQSLRTRSRTAVSYEPQSRPQAERTVNRLALGWLVAMAATWLGLISLSERSLPFTMFLYGPRWVVLLPLIFLVPAALIWSRSSLLVLAAGAWIAVGPIMGFRLSSSVLRADGRAPPPTPLDGIVRVLSFNSQGGGGVRLHLDELIATNSPSVMAFQECGSGIARSLADRAGWHFAQYQSLCVLSRWAVVRSDTMPRAAFERISELGYGGSATVIRYTIAHPRGNFDLVNLHLETPRRGLAGILGDDGLLNDQTGLPNFPRSIDSDRFSVNAEIRSRESERASYWSARHADATPIVVAGDFNMPVESSIFRRYWRVLKDAFETRGNGFGYSKHEGSLLHARIDHILISPRSFEVRGAWVLPDAGSDHRPVMADLKYRP